MKIKNIQQYRTEYKNVVRGFKSLESHDEHFIGNEYLDLETGEKKHGWFDFYHGDKNGYGKPIDGIVLS